MSNRYHSLTIVLEEDMKDEDAEGLMDALLHLKGVVGVEPNISDPNTVTAVVRARYELGMKLLDIVYPKN